MAERHGVSYLRVLRIPIPDCTAARLDDSNLLVAAPYWAAVALHGTSTGGATLNQTLIAWGMMLFFSLIDLFIASRLFTLMLYKARADATLGME